ncbi:MAG TPA: Fic family protein [Thermoanaerobaculia bacterium]|nr:Fic family protein [Thermoanaerobaculia bacterium]
MPRKAPLHSATRTSPAPSSEPSRSTPSPSSDSQTRPGSTPQTRYLTAQDIIDLHRGLSLEFGGHQATPGVVESQFGLLNTVQRPQATVFGKDAFPTFAEKATALVFAMLQNMPFFSGNRRVALASLIAFCELNQRQLDFRLLDEKTAEQLVKKVATHRESGVPPENIFRDFRDLMNRAVVMVHRSG